jgi:transglutaminase-like putative cysteine protease
MPRRFLCFVICLVAFIPPVAARAAEERTLVDEEWNAAFLGTDKVGYVHSTTHKIREKDRDLIEMRVESVLTIKRFGQTLELVTDYTSIETPDGKVVRVDNRSKQGPVETRSRGEVAGNVMKLSVDTLGKQTTANIPWSDDIHGQYGEDLVLKKRPLKPGDTRSYRSFSPDLNQVMTNVITGQDTEEVTLLDGSKRSLQKILAQVEGIPALKNMKVYSWVDAKGETIKQHSDFVISTTFYRTTKELATAKPAEITSDFGVTTLIKADKRITNPYETSEIVYRIEITDEDPFETIPQDDRQKLSKDENGKVLLTIKSFDPRQSAPEGAKKPKPEFLESNNWLQSDNAKVIQAAKDAVGDATDPWDKAQRIEKWVHQNISEKNFGRALDSAAVVVETRSGDCTEHGVLLAAMARAAGIPARVAVGLVYAERLAAFGYHMWSEVYINGRWIPVDGTLGLGHASPGHIKIFDSSMAGVDATATLLPVAAVMNRLKIEVVSWKHTDVN